MVRYYLIIFFLISFFGVSNLAQAARSKPIKCTWSSPDTDRDGYPDCKETCDNDPKKNSPGVCGCGVADIDADHDSVFACRETCDNDPQKTSPGVCGCGVADVDADHDGVYSCREACDNDPQKTSPGVCGCGVADVDADNDGIPDCIDPTPNGNVETPTPSTSAYEVTPKVLVIVEAATRDFAVSQGFTEDDIINNIFEQLENVEKNYNNGELLPYVFNFQIIDVQFKSMPEPHTTLPSETPEDEDITINFDTRYAGSPHAGNGGIMIKSVSFTDASSTAIVLTHEIGHIFGGVDMYVSQITSNEVYPGALWAMQSKGYMGVSNTYGANWEPITQEIIKACEAKIPHPHAYEWFLSWEPDSINVHVTDANGSPVNNAQVSVYRSPHYWRTLYETDLYAEGASDANGDYEIPNGLVGENTYGYKFYDKYMVAVTYNDETYLYWLSAYQDIMLPFLDGNEDRLDLNFMLDDEHLYVPADEHFSATTDIEVTSLTATPMAVKYGDVVNRSFVIKNNGPDAYSGTIAFQLWLSKDTAASIGNDDVGFGGYSLKLNLAPGASYTFNSSNSISLAVPLGNVYVMGSVALLPPYTTSADTIVYTDPNPNNNVKMGSIITVSQ
ncbi:carboxypeptidase-like regulatory domain-containing protein [bacterium]|nr:carboxypeptidase-like regulatory domain-containing protein [bacterium]